MTKAHTIGEFQKERSEAMKREVEAYFVANPFASKKECMKDLGFSYSFVTKAFSELRKERAQAKSKG